LSPPTAAATVFVLIIFDKNSHIAQDKSSISVKARLYLEKQPDKWWLITRVEIQEIDRLTVGWRQIR
jgi:hypothetical protein